MPLFIDVTPILINRTAIYRLICSTLEEFPNLPIKVCGVHVPRALLRNRFFAGILRRAVSAILSHPLLSLTILPAQHLVSRLVSPNGPTFYFDPLYTLFEPCLNKSKVAVLDLTPITCSQFHSPKIARLYRAAFKRIAMSTCQVLAISKSTQTDLWTNFGLDPETIRILPLYSPTKIDASPVTETPPPERFLLVVGSCETRKNLKNTIQAFSQSGLAEMGVNLKIVGGPGVGHTEIVELATEIDGVQLLGQVKDSDLFELYSRCVGFVLISFWEGFGLPYLEAMRAGKPILASATGAAPEVCGPKVLYADPYRCDQIALQMVKLAFLSPNERRDMVESYEEILGKYSRANYLTTFREIVDEVSI